MSQSKIDILQRALHRERESRKAAERILEAKSTELYLANKKLEQLYFEVESELTKTDSQLQGVFENIIDPYIIIDLSGRILKMNEAAKHLLAISDDDPKRNLAKMVHPEDVTWMQKIFKKFIKAGSYSDLEVRLITKKNEIKLIHVNGSIIYDKGMPVAAQAIVRDITDLKEEEKVLQLINNIAKSILGKLNIYDIAYEITENIAKFLNTNDCVIYLYNESNQTLEQIAAYGKKINKHNQIINKITLKSGQGIVGYVAKSGKAEIIKNTKLDKRYKVDIEQNNSEITVPIILGDKVIGIIDSENEIENFYTNKQLETLISISKVVAMQLQSAIDLRERQAAEERLKESEQRFSTLILNLDRGVLLVDENGKIAVVNNRYCEFFKLSKSPDQLIGQYHNNFLKQNKILFEDADYFENSTNNILKNQKEVLGEELIMVDGRIFERDYIPIYRDNKFRGYLWSYKDFTLRRKYRKSIEAQRGKYLNIITNMNLGLLEVDNDDKILMTNQSFVEMSGYSEEELLGKVARDVFVEKTNRNIILQENLKRQKGKSNSYEIQIINKKGETRYWLVSGGPNYDINGQVMGSIGIHLDITELKSLETQKEQLLYKLEKSNDELQEYAHIVSHDLKSPLRSIYALLEWIKEDNIGLINETSLGHFKLIESTLEKMEGLITDILHYSEVGMETDLKQEFDLNNLLDEVKSLLFIPKHITIHVKQHLPILFGDKIKIHQLFQNLLSNAIKFNDKEKGIIEIDCEEKQTHYQFSIKDNGIGIEEKYFKKIFEIFNSLQARVDSTGIGLAIVKKIIEIHKGEIWVESIPGKETTFYFTIKK